MVSKFILERLYVNEAPYKVILCAFIDLHQILNTEGCMKSGKQICIFNQFADLKEDQK